MYLTKNSKSPYYQIIYDNNGRLTTKSTKKKLKSEALKVLSDFEKFLETQSKVKPIKLSEFKNEYYNYILTTRSVSYLRSVKFSLEMLQKYTGDIFLTKINTKVIEQFIILTFNRSKSTAVLFYKTLKAAFSKALFWEYIKSNPFDKVKKPKTKSKIPVFISGNEISQIVGVVKESFLKDFYITAFNTGMRAGELCNLQWNAIDLTERIITVKNTDDFTTKSKKERIIPINDTLYFVLKRRLPKIRSLNNQKDYVFYKVKGIRLNVDYVSKKFKKAIRELGLNEDLKLHSCRHGFASTLIQSGVSLFTIQQLLGHQNFKVTQLYTSLQPKNLFDAVQKININQ